MNHSKVSRKHFDKPYRSPFPIFKHLMIFFFGKSEIEHAKKKKEAGGQFPHKCFQIENPHWGTNQTQHHANGRRRWRGEEERGQKKRGWKPCRTVPWHLNPGCCLFLTAQRQIVLLHGDYWPLGHYHLNFPGCFPVKQKNRVLSWIITSRNMLWKEEREKRAREGRREGGKIKLLIFLVQGGHAVKANCFAPTVATQRLAKVNGNRQLVTSNVKKQRVTLVWGGTTVSLLSLAHRRDLVQKKTPLETVES